MKLGVRLFRQEKFCLAEQCCPIKSFTEASAAFLSNLWTFCGAWISIL